MAKKSKNKSKKHWRGVLRAMKRSGLGVAGFCRKRHLKPASLYAWRRRLGGARMARGSRRGCPSNPETFMPVQVITGGEDRPVLELVLKNGRVLRLYREVSTPALVEMAQALEAEAC